MPPRISPADERLMAAYQEAALRLTRILSQATGSRRRVVLRQVDSLIAELDQLSAEYIAEQVPVQFKAGSEEAVKELRTHSGFDEIDETFSTAHTEAAQQLAEDATLKFASALEGVKREARSVVSAAVKQKIQAELIVSEIEGAARPAERAKEILEQEGIVALRSATRKWTLENYASMLTQTILADAHNTGAMTRYASNGVQYVEVIEHADTEDSTCGFMRGKIVFLGDRRLLPPYHPNCFGGIRPFLGEPEAPIMSPEDERIPAEVRKMLLKSV